MSKIDKHGSTWRAVERFIESQRADCIEFLIADRDSEKQRGALLMLDRLEALVDPDWAQSEEPSPPLRGV